MKTYNPDSRINLAQSFIQRADAIKAGRGFWNGNVICNNPTLCKEKREELMARARNYMIQHQELTGD